MDWLMKVFQNIETLPVLLMNYQWSREQKWNPFRVTVVSTRTSERPKLRCLLKDENNEGLLQKTHRYSRSQSGNFG